MSFVEIQNGNTINAKDKDLEDEKFGSGDDLDTFDADGPNRLTIWVPTERVALNLGAAVFGSSGKTEMSAGNPKPEIDAGFVAQTNNHIHFHTFGTLDGPIPPPPPIIPGEPGGIQGRTVVRLGTPVTVVTAGSTYASANTGGLELLQSSDNKEAIEIGSAYPNPYNAWKGYAMLTEGGASHESLGNQLIVSGNADVRIGAKRSVLVGSPGYVHIRAAAGESVTNVVGNGTFGEDDDPFAAGSWVTGKPAWLEFDLFLATVTEALAAFNAFASIYWMQYYRPTNVDKPGWTAFLSGDAGDKISDVLSQAFPIIGAGVALVPLISQYNDVLNPNEPKDNTVTIYGSDGVSITSSAATSVHGLLSATLSGTLTAAVSSTVSTAVSSLVSASVSGLVSSMSGLLTVGMSSAFGSATVSGKSKVQVSSWGRIFVEGNDQVQINSADSTVNIHGNTGFYLACGSGAEMPSGYAGRDYASSDGWGILGDAAEGLKIGKFSAANYFATPGPVSSSQISIDDNAIILCSGLGSIQISNDGIFIGQGVGADKIHLG